VQNKTLPRYNAERKSFMSIVNCKRLGLTSNAAADASINNIITIEKPIDFFEYEQFVILLANITRVYNNENVPK